MQMMAVVGIQPPRTVTRGDAWHRLPQEGPAMLEHDPRPADDPRDRDDDPRDRDVRDRDRTDPRDVFLRELDLPRGPERERVALQLLQRRGQRPQVPFVYHAVFPGTHYLP